MLRVFPILVSAALLAACGQKGPLYMPTSPAARPAPAATETLAPSTSVSSPALQPASAPPATGTASPVRTP
ncbi:lipoprotein [Caenimonas sedimenti]|uniref:Lipoprotein n=1 Tax=Caenimonas sedimenti TaxID=2596921 RepID=A0A562ZPJ9_9BURK|nr:lipoprotein [Caenimonas sedimenti]